MSSVLFSCQICRASSASKLALAPNDIEMRYEQKPQVGHKSCMLYCAVPSSRYSFPLRKSQTAFQSFPSNFSSMGKPIPSAARLQDFARVVSSSDKLRLPKQAKPISRIRVSIPEASRPGGGAVRTDDPKKMEVLAKSLEPEGNGRVPLARVVSDCARRWFQDTLKEAKAGDGAMQVLVGQMYNSGYGVPRDPQKGRAWINKASKARSSVWRVSDKQPGYNASDSDSGEMDNHKK